MKNEVWGWQSKREQSAKIARRQGVKPDFMDVVVTLSADNRAAVSRVCERMRAEGATWFRADYSVKSVVRQDTDPEVTTIIFGWRVRPDDGMSQPSDTAIEG